jgi:hypothetical protein
MRAPARARKILLEDEREGLQDEGVAGTPEVEHGAIGLGDAREEPE